MGAGAQKCGWRTPQRDAAALQLTSGTGAFDCYPRGWRTRLRIKWWVKVDGFAVPMTRMVRAFETA